MQRVLLPGYPAELVFESKNICELDSSKELRAGIAAHLHATSALAIEKQGSLDVDMSSPVWTRRRVTSGSIWGKG